MKKIAVLLVFISHIITAQNLQKISMGSSDPHSLYMNDGESTELFYYKIEPKGKPKGVLTILPSGGEKIEDLLSKIDLHKKAYDNNLLVLIPSLNWGTIQRIPDISFLDSIFKQVVEEHNLSKDKFILCGLSNGGMVSLTYGIHSVRDSSTFLVPKGIVGIDPPIDFVRFYRYCEREVKKNFSPAGVAEAQWFINVYNQVYGGPPDRFLQNYIEASIFSFEAESGGNAQYLNEIGILMYSDLNIDFLINKRRRDLYDWNGIDLVAFVNQLRLNGNTNAEVVISQNKGTRPDGTKHPHSWSIMDTDKTMNWILNLLLENEIQRQEE